MFNIIENIILFLDQVNLLIKLNNSRYITYHKLTVCSTQMYVCTHNYIIVLLTSSKCVMNTLVSLSSVNIHTYEGIYIQM